MSFFKLDRQKQSSIFKMESGPVWTFDPLTFLTIEVNIDWSLWLSTNNEACRLTLLSDYSRLDSQLNDYDTIIKNDLFS